jgi:hypothetical protein
MDRFDRPTVVRYEPHTDTPFRGVTLGPQTFAQFKEEQDRLQRIESKNRRHREEQSQIKGGSGTAVVPVYYGPEREVITSAAAEQEYKELIRLHRARIKFQSLPTRTEQEKKVKRGSLQSNTLWLKRIIKSLLAMGQTTEQIAARLTASDQK